MTNTATATNLIELALASETVEQFRIDAEALIARSPKAARHIMSVNVDAVATMVGSQLLEDDSDLYTFTHTPKNVTMSLDQTAAVLGSGETR